MNNKPLYQRGNMVALCTLMQLGTKHYVYQAAMERYAALYDKRMDGLLLAGTTGAGYLLPRSTLIDGLLKPVKRTFSGIVALNVTRDCPWETIELAKQAEAEGANMCVLMVPSRTVGMSFEAQIAYIEEIVRSTQSPWMLYHIPSNGSVVDFRTISHFRDHPQIVRLKCSDPSREVADAFVRAAEARIAIDMGWDTFIGDWLSEGRNFICGGSHLLLIQLERLKAAAGQGHYPNVREINRLLDRWCGLAKALDVPLHAINQFAASELFGGSAEPPFPIRRLRSELCTPVKDEMCNFQLLK